LALFWYVFGQFLIPKHPETMSFMTSPWKGRLTNSQSSVCCVAKTAGMEARHGRVQWLNQPEHLPTANKKSIMAWTHLAHNTWDTMGRKRLSITLAAKGQFAAGWHLKIFVGSAGSDT